MRKPAKSSLPGRRSNATNPKKKERASTVVSIWWLNLPLRLVIVVGLTIDAYIHYKLAPEYNAVHSTISEDQIFYTEAIAAILTALLTIFIRRTTVYVIALLTAGSALVAVMVNTYVHLGAIGPIPDMYEHEWFGDKVTATIAETAAMVAAAAMTIVARFRHPQE